MLLLAAIKRQTNVNFACLRGNKIEQFISRIYEAEEETNRTEQQQNCRSWKNITRQTTS